MALFYEGQRGIEPVGVGIFEQVGNGARFNVVGGCAITYSGADMTFSVAAGAINCGDYGTVAVAAQSGVTGLTADSTNPTWAWILLDNSGTASVSLGTPSADPMVPSLTINYVPLALVKIEAGQTVANSIAYKIDKRLPGLTQVFRLASDLTVTNSGTLVDLDGFAPFIDPNQTWDFVMEGNCTVASTPGITLGFASLPAGMTVDGHLTISKTTATSSSYGFGPTLSVVSTDGEIFRCWGWLKSSATSGVVQFQAAQFVPDAASLVIANGAVLRVQRVL